MHIVMHEHQFIGSIWCRCQVINFCVEIFYALHLGMKSLSQSCYVFDMIYANVMEPLYFSVVC